MVQRLLIAPLLALAACSQRPVAEDRGGGIDAPHRRIPWQRVATLPHATDSFTQGLVFVGPRLYESVGLVGHSRLLELDPATGATLRSQPWPARVGSDERPFAEGLAHADGRLIQLSWHSEVALTWYGMRQQAEKQMIDGVMRPSRCLADFVAPKDSGITDYVGGFICTAGIGVVLSSQAA